MPTTSSDPRRTAWRRAIAGAAVAVTLLGAAGCSSPAPKEKELSDALVDSGLSRKVADCTAAALTDSLTESELAEITERGSGGAPVDDPKVTGDSADKLSVAMTACRELLIAETPVSTTVAPEDGGSTTTPSEPITDGAELNPASTTTTAAP